MYLNIILDCWLVITRINFHIHHNRNRGCYTSKNRNRVCENFDNRNRGCEYMTTRSITRMYYEF